jgi:hypothetical protein
VRSAELVRVAQPIACCGESRGMTDETRTRPVEGMLAVRGGLLRHQLSGRNP